MKASSQVINPDRVTVAITLEMTVGQWKALLNKLPSEWPAWEVSSMVMDVLDKSLGKVEQTQQVER